MSLINCPTTLNDIGVDCSLAAGGIKRFIICPRDAVNIPSPNANNMIDVADFTCKDPSANTHFVEYKFRPQTSSITTTADVDVAIGSASVTSEISLQFTRMETTKRVALQQLIGVGAVALVQTFDNQWVMVGYDMPIYATNLVQQSGMNISDLNGYTVTLTDISLQLPFFCIATDAAIQTLLTAVPAPDEE